MSIQPGARIEVAGDWQIRVTPGTITSGSARTRIAKELVLKVEPATVVTVNDERHDSLPPFNPNAAPWTKGAKLDKLTTYETTAPDLLIPASLKVKAGPGDAKRFEEAKDYGFEPRWATIGRLPNGEIRESTPVWLDYTCGWHRIDSIIIGAKGAISLRQGTPHNATPHPPALMAGETAVANIWVPGRLEKLTADNLYPILERAYPHLQRPFPIAKEMLPKTWEKLQKKQPVHVLAWGDSVTEGGQASDDAHRYQSRFVTLLRHQFPGCPIQLTTTAWGGRNTDSFLNEPPGSPHNFEHYVLDVMPDLIVMEFVNDAYMSPPMVEEKYSYLLKRFQEIGAEWVILTPHYVRPDWMNEKTVRVEQDPRPYVAGLRQFAAKHHVALADASLRWGHLVKEGIPYVTLLCNSINHPDDRGHEIFAQALMELFR